VSPDLGGHWRGHDGGDGADYGGGDLGGDYGGGDGGDNGGGEATAAAAAAEVEVARAVSQFGQELHAAAARVTVRIVARAAADERDAALELELPASLTAREAVPYIAVALAGPVRGPFAAGLKRARLELRLVDPARGGAAAEEDETLADLQSRAKRAHGCPQVVELVVEARA
jgi:hypothetical protein